MPAPKNPSDYWDRVTANFETVCDQKWRDELKIIGPRCKMTKLGRQHGLSMLSDEEKASILAYLGKGNSTLDTANHFRVPYMIVLEIRRLAAPEGPGRPRVDIPQSAGGKLRMIERRLIGELELRTCTPTRRAQMSLEDINTALKTAREHIAARQRRAPEGGEKRPMNILTRGDWTTEESKPS